MCKSSSSPPNKQQQQVRLSVSIQHVAVCEIHLHPIAWPPTVFLCSCFNSRYFSPYFLKKWFNLTPFIVAGEINAPLLQVHDFLFKTGSGRFCFVLSPAAPRPVCKVTITTALETNRLTQWSLSNARRCCFSFTEVSSP